MGERPARPDEPDTAHTRDCRRFRRVAFRSRATLTPVPDGDAIEGNIVEMSLGDARVICCAPLLPGRLVSLTFCFEADAGRAITEGPILGRVTELHHDDDTAIVVVRFSRPLSRRSAPALARALGDALGPPAPSRRPARRTGHARRPPPGTGSG